MLRDTYIDQFTKLYASGAWFGDPYAEKLADISAEEAFAVPSEGIHSIAELVSHVIYWRSPLIKRLEGQKDYKGSMKAVENWLPLADLKKQGWPALRQALDDSQQSLIRLLKNADDSFFAQTYRDSTTMKDLTEGIIQHDIYHLGQIALVLKIVRS